MVVESSGPLRAVATAKYAATERGRNYKSSVREQAAVYVAFYMYKIARIAGKPEETVRNGE